jgi:hypothetical protein
VRPVLEQQDERAPAVGGDLLDRAQVRGLDRDSTQVGPSAETNEGSWPGLTERRASAAQGPGAGDPCLPMVFGPGSRDLPCPAACLILSESD